MEIMKKLFFHEKSNFVKFRYFFLKNHKFRIKLALGEILGVKVITQV